MKLKQDPLDFNATFDISWWNDEIEAQNKKRGIPAHQWKIKTGMLASIYMLLKRAHNEIPHSSTEEALKLITVHLETKLGLVVKKECYPEEWGAVNLTMVIAVPATLPIGEDNPNLAESDPDVKSSRQYPDPQQASGSKYELGDRNGEPSKPSTRK
jgi:hypothetical protein